MNVDTPSAMSKLPPLPQPRFSATDRALLRDYPNLPIIDGSTIDTWKKCRRRGYLTNPSPFGQSLRPLKTALPLEFGTLFHNALDLVYSESPPNYAKAAPWFRRMFNDRIGQIVKQIRPFPSEVTKLEESRDLGMAMLEEWAQWAPKRDDFTVVATEAPLLVPITVPLNEYRPTGFPTYRTSSGVIIALYYMRVDGLVRDRNANLWLREYKTAGRWWSPFYLDLSQQVTRYCWGIGQRLGEYPKGILMDFFLKAAITDPPILKDGKPTTDIRKLAHVTAERYQHALLDTRALDPKHRDVLIALREREDEAGHPTLRRETPLRTRTTLESAGPRLAREVIKLLESIGDTDPTEDQFGCNICPVQTLCRVMEDGDEWGPLADALFERVPPMWGDDMEALEA